MLDLGRLMLDLGRLMPAADAAAGRGPA